VTRAFGWNPPAIAHRGTRVVAAAAEGLPEAVSLLDHAPPVTDQGPLGSCTGHAVAVAVAIRLKMQSVPGAELPSPLDLYLGARALEGTVDRDAGAMLADVLAHGEREGFAADRLWPHALRGGEFRGPAPAAVVEARGRSRIVGHEPLDYDVATVCWQLACGFPVVLGLRTYAGFEAVGIDGKIPMPDGAQRGGHAMCAIGYSLPRGALLVQNSWGKSFGQHGLGWLPLPYAMNPFWCGELHAVRTVRVLGSQTEPGR
jgi:hypothetical protein